METFEFTAWNFLINRRLPLDRATLRTYLPDQLQRYSSRDALVDTIEDDDHRSMELRHNFFRISSIPIACSAFQVPTTIQQWQKCLLSQRLFLLYRKINNNHRAVSFIYSVCVTNGLEIWATRTFERIILKTTR